MKCPYCEYADSRMKLHRHLVEAHLDNVTTERDETTGKMKYVVGCPMCGLRYQHVVKPRYKDPRFLEEFKAEIALVAFDQVLYHVEEKHPIEAGLPLQTEDPISLRPDDASPSHAEAPNQQAS